MIDRRTLLKLSGALAAAGFCGLSKALAETPAALIQRTIPGTTEQLPVIGMGTSRTFDTPGDKASIAALEQVMRVFFEGQGSVIDSSPMYGEAESRVGDVLRALPASQNVFAATKVWTRGREQGIEQMETSARRMNVERFDLIAVHNLKDWQTQLDTLQQWKEAGKVRYIGITTSHGRDHREFIKVMRSQPLDFVQFSYNIEDRLAEEELLPAAQELNIATMINRPYQRGALFSQSRNKPLPPLAQALGCTSWAQFYLKFILAHPAVTCIIPATAKPKHMADNMQANFGPVPSADQKEEMLRIFNAL